MGLDVVLPIILKESKSIITKPLHKLFNLSLSTGTFPIYWKKSYIIRIFKSGDKSNIINYNLFLNFQLPQNYLSLLLLKNYLNYCLIIFGLTNMVFGLKNLFSCFHSLVTLIF